MSIWGEIGKALNSTIKNPATFKPLDVLVIENADKLDTKLSSFKNSAENGGIPIVRKIQRGTFYIPIHQKVTNVSLSGFINLRKMEVILNGFRVPHDYNYIKYMGAPYLNSLSLTQLSIICEGEASSQGASGGTLAYGSYQVIEYY